MASLSKFAMCLRAEDGICKCCWRLLMMCILLVFYISFALADIHKMYYLVGQGQSVCGIGNITPGI